jgi:hypothetical protein
VPDSNDTHAADTSPPELHLELVTVLRARDAAELLVAKSVLQAAGIEFATKNECVQDLFGWGRFPRGANLFMGPVELQVRSCDARDAQELLEGVTEAAAVDADDTMTEGSDR